jgi:hypothetical protein
MAERTNAERGLLDALSATTSLVSRGVSSSMKFESCGAASLNR